MESVIVGIASCVGHVKELLSFRKRELHPNSGGQCIPAGQEFPGIIGNAGKWRSFWPTRVISPSFIPNSNRFSNHADAATVCRKCSSHRLASTSSTFPWTKTFKFASFRPGKNSAWNFFFVRTRTSTPPTVATVVSPKCLIFIRTIHWQEIVTYNCSYYSSSESCVTPLPFLFNQ